MKKIILSAAVAAMAFSTSAMAADKGIDITTNGQAVVYYQTSDNGADQSLMSSDNSSANVGVQLDLGADLGNNFAFGSQLTYLGTAGLEKTVVETTRQDTTQSLNNDTNADISLTKIFVAKKIANTTVKLGRQELPKSLSPLAYSEGWNVFKNTFDAIVAINSDIPNTTLVAAYVSSVTNVSDRDNMEASTDADFDTATAGDQGDVEAAGAAYMITAQTTAIPMATVTASYYSVKNMEVTTDVLTAPLYVTDDSISATAMWLDVAVADKSLPMGLNVGLQAGKISPKSEVSAVDALLDDTTAYGLKASISPIDALKLCAAYTSVSGDKTKVNVGINNFGGVKSPLFTQMVANQGNIGAAENDTYMLKASYSLGDMGTVTARYSDTSSEYANDDFNEIDLMYSVKAGGVKYFAAYVMTEQEEGAGVANTDTDIVRVWARYNF